MLKAFRQLALGAFLTASLAFPALAQDHFFPTPGNALVPGYVTMCIVANQAVPCPAGGGVTSGTTTCTSCTAGGVLFNNAGVVTTDSDLTKTGSGGTSVLSVGNTIQFTGTNPGLIKSVAFGNIGMWATAVTFTTAAGVTSFSLNPVANNVFSFTDISGNAFAGRMAFGGTTNAFPAIARNGTTLQFVLGDGSAAAPISAAGISATLASATGTNAVCNTPGTTTALSVQVWATGCAASSMRFKDAITAIDREKAFETVLALRPVSYFYRHDYADDPEKHIGFTAEQANSLPSPVDGYSLTTKEKDSDLLHGFKYNEIAPLLVAAIQQLKADNDNLRAEIEALKAAK